VKETDATALFPGGFGTLDEGFEMITLMQTGKSRPRPIVLMEPKGSTYWAGIVEFMKKKLIKKGFIKKDDLQLFKITKSADQAASFIGNFYRVYHSIRYVAGAAVLRLNREISDSTLKLINREFKDILKSGEIRRCLPTDKEIQEREFLALPRLTMNFNLRDYGRLCQLIQVINQD
jgi:hypothetical protein